jgi:hypothetical protein
LILYSVLFWGWIGWWDRNVFWFIFQRMLCQIWQIAQKYCK